ncbi:MAG: hypothetical protein IKE01_07220 [Clostridia bacterium]|nr:hypothetical protein [Clostridia bacterium]
MKYKEKKSGWGSAIKLIILLLIVGFVVACYKVDFLCNNEYISIAKSKISGVINKITNSASDSFSALVESYEPDEEDDSKYEISDSQNRYYYNQLDDNSRIIYAEILNNIDKIKNGEDNIKISSKLSSLSSSEDMNTALMVAFQNAWDAFRNDNVDMFYIDGTKMCLVTKTIKRGNQTKYEFYISKGKNSNYFIDGFSSKASVEEAEAFVKQNEDEILSNITDKNDYYKIMHAHNWIVEHLEYNLEESPNNANLYGALKDRKVVCEGYARLFKSLMDKMDIPCVFVSGVGLNSTSDTREDHAWNYVFLKGEWYAIDATWDDPIIIGSGSVSSDLKYKYFLKGSKEFYKSHIEEGRLVDSGMEFKYPQISENDYIK